MKTGDKSALIGSGSGFKGGPTANRTHAVANKGALATMGAGEYKGGPSKTKPGDTGKHEAAMASRSDTTEYRGGSTPTVGHSRSDHKTAMRGENPIVGKGGAAQGDPVPKGPAQTAPRGPKAKPKPKMQASRRAPPPDPDEAQEDPREEATESPSMERSEDAQEPDEQGTRSADDELGENPAEESGEPPAAESAETAQEPDEQGGGVSMPAGAAQGGPGSPDDPKAKELFDLAVARSLEVLAKQGQDLDTALRADPVKATVGFGTGAVHSIALAADDAGKPIPFQVLIQVGMQVIKVLGSIANEKGYLPEEQLTVFLKEAFQQSLAKYAQLDVQAGKMTQQQVQQVQQKLQGGQAAPPGGAMPPAPMPPPPPQGPGALAQAGA